VNIKDTIAAINQMLANGIIEHYAVGGAVGATFYLEPVATLDVDVFITFRPEAGRLLASPQPLFDYLKAHGGRMEGEYIVIAGWPVQFLPAANPLVAEALDSPSPIPTGACRADHRPPLAPSHAAERGAHTVE
jgi:hypothetical protein